MNDYDSILQMIEINHIKMTENHIPNVNTQTEMTEIRHIFHGGWSGRITISQNLFLRILIF